jgi:hypothetical protein
MAQLVEALRYKPEGRGFDSQWCNLNFSLKYSMIHNGPGVDSAANRIISWGKGGRCFGLNNLTTFMNRLS